MPLTDETVCNCADIYEQEWRRVDPTQQPSSSAISGFGFPGQAGEGKPHKIGCDEFHEHHAPKCCALDCWCVTKPPSGLMTLERAKKLVGIYVSDPHTQQELGLLIVQDNRAARLETLKWVLQQIHYTDQPGQPRTYRVKVDVIERYLKELEEHR